MMMGQHNKLLLFLLQCFLASGVGFNSKGRLPHRRDVSTTATATTTSSSSSSTSSPSSSSSSRHDHHKSNLLLQLHELYTRQPPHDTSLYDILEVSPNATCTEIAKSYRKISRRLHPDKLLMERSRRNQHNNDKDEISGGTSSSYQQQQQQQQQLARVRAAYEILKHDSRRLPYHRHGLLNPMDAVYILTGGSNSVFAATSAAGSGRGGPPYYHHPAVVTSNIEIDDDDEPITDDQRKHALQMELLELMGYYHYHHYHHRNKHQRKKFPFFFSDQHEGDHDDNGDAINDVERVKRHRVQFIVTSLLEKLIPVIDGTLPEHVFFDALIQQCDQWKTLPLGAQIVRCIGRAYRYSGERFLRRGSWPFASVQDNVRSVWRQTKYFTNAAVAGGRVVLEERKVGQQQQQQQQRKMATSSSSTNHYHDNTIQEQQQPPVHWEDNPDEMDASVLSDETIHTQELDRAHQAVLESLQVEALWKICKIDLDRTIRTACNILLDGGPATTTTSFRTDGWIGPNGNTIRTHNGRIQLALLLVRMGNIMVHRSKEGTAWME